MEQNQVYIHEDCRAMVQLLQPPKPRTKKLMGFVWILMGSPGSSRIYFAATHTTNPSAHHQPEGTPRRAEDVISTWVYRGSRAYLDSFALQGSNRVSPSLSYTKLAYNFRPQTLRAIFFAFVVKNSGIWILWNMGKVEFSPERVQKTHTIAFQCARLKNEKNKKQR